MWSCSAACRTRCCRSVPAKECGDPCAARVNGSVVSGIAAKGLSDAFRTPLFHSYRYSGTFPNALCAEGERRVGQPLCLCLRGRIPRLVQAPFRAAGCGTAGTTAGPVERRIGGSGGEPAEPCGGLRNDVRRLSEVAVRDAGSGCGASVSGRHGRIGEREQPCLGGRTTEPDAGRERIAGQRTTWDIVEPAVGLSDRESIGAGPRRRTPESDGSGGEAAEPQCAFMPRGISPLLRAACRPCCGWK